MMRRWRILMEPINYIQLLEIDKEFGTPFYLMDGNQYRINLRNFISAFTARYPRLIAGYSFKTNYVPALCQIAKEEGAYAEVVSQMEYELAKSIGFTHIIFNGPIKKKEVLFDALNAGCIVNLDSMYEVEYIKSYQETRNFQKLSVGLRLNIDLRTNDGHSHVQCGLREGRFGFPKELIGEAIKTLRECNVDIVSLHGHTSSSDRAVVNYKLIVSQMLEVCETFSLNNISYFDVGGGFFGAAAKGIDVSNKPKYIDYANAILDIVLQNLWFRSVQPSIVIEPGVSVVANVFSYVSKFFQHKVINGRNFMTTDGTVFDVKPTMHSNNLPHSVVQCYPSSERKVYNVVGSTCMEKDVILNDVEMPTIEYGDYLMIHGVGAYTIALTPTFINYLSPIFSLDKQGLQVIRRRQNINDVLSLYN